MNIEPITLVRQVDKITINNQNQNNLMDEMILFDGFCIQYSNFMGPNPSALPYATDWRYTLNSIRGDLSPKFIQSLLIALECLVFTFDDKDNRLREIPRDLCVTSIQLQIQFIEIKIWTEVSCLILKIGKGVLVETDNFATIYWVDRTFLQIPTIIIQCLVYEEVLEKIETIWYEVLHFETSISLSKYQKESNSSQVKKNQREFIRYNDNSTGRCAHLLEADYEREKLDYRFPYYKYDPPFNFMDEAVECSPSFIDHDITQRSRGYS